MLKKVPIPARRPNRSASCKRPASNTQYTTNNSTHFEKSPSQPKNPIQKNLVPSNRNPYLRKIYEGINNTTSNHQTSVISNKSLAPRNNANKVADLHRGAFSSKHSAARVKSPDLKNDGRSPSPGATSVLPTFHSVAQSMDDDHFIRYTEVLLPWQKLMREFDREAELLGN